jgi:hypothetical protein
VHNIQLNHFSELLKLFPKASEDVKRKILLASVGQVKTLSWIYQLREQQDLFSEWTRRAYIIASKSLPSDQKRFLHGNIKLTLTQRHILEKYILAWAK